MVKLAALIEGVETVDIPVGDEVLPVRFSTDKLTYAMQRKLLAAKDGEEVDTLIEVLSVIIVGWDLTDDDGGDIPVNRESLYGLPIRFVNKLALAVTEAVSLPQPPSGTSDAS